jgi:hypothetical protein
MILVPVLYALLYRLRAPDEAGDKPAATEAAESA